VATRPKCHPRAQPPRYRLGTTAPARRLDGWLERRAPISTTDAAGTTEAADPTDELLGDGADAPETPADALPDAAVATGDHARSLGVGARVSLFAMTDGFVDVILGALRTVDSGSLHVVTDDVSTLVMGPEDEVLRYLRDLIAAAASVEPGTHMGVQIMLSRGCPGAVDDAFDPNEPLPVIERIELIPTGLRAAAHWALYPLGVAGHMPAIEGVIADAQASGLTVELERFVTRLEGDVAEVLSTVGAAWTTVGAAVPHVVTHLTLSLDSPTPDR
jgi:energy-coupling factor transport system substrate-specific component